MSNLVHHVESARWARQLLAAVQVRGWATFSSGERICRFSVRRNGKILSEAEPLLRPDVRAHFGGCEAAAFAGFAFTVPHNDLDTHLQLAAQDVTGRVTVFTELDPRALPDRGPMLGDYPTWIAAHERSAPPAAPTAGPLFSLLLPVYNPPLEFLRACLDSLLAQAYSHWEVCIVDDASPRSEISALLEEFARREPRARLFPRRVNGGIARATNDALAGARGEFVAFVDHDDLLRPHALTAFAQRLHDKPATDVLYSDEDKITADGNPVVPFAKPAWSPEFLRGVMYIGHLLAVRTELARRVGGFNPAYDGIQDFEFMLRVGEATSRIEHVPAMLYRWRQSAASSALHGNIKGDMDSRQAAAVQAHLDRIGDPRRAIPLGGHRIHLAAPEPSTDYTRVVGGEIMATLLDAARASRTGVIILSLPHDPDPAPDWLALAERPDSGVVGPVLVDEAHRVVAAGLTFAGAETVPLMSGFGIDGDGYNGSLRCNREVAAVPARAAAVRRTLVLQFAQPNQTWLEFLNAIARAGFHHRICASAQLTVAEEIPRATSLDQKTDDYFPAIFNPATGDYSLHSTAPRRPTLIFHIDSPSDWDDIDLGVIVRGWAHAEVDSISGVRLRIGGMRVDGVVGLPRPDVAAAYPNSPVGGNVGFEVRARPPTGRHRLSLEFRRDADEWETAFVSEITVHRRVWPVWLRRGVESDLLAFQFPAHATHAPQPIQAERFPQQLAPLAPRLAIVTPSFRSGRFLAETVTSVLRESEDVDYVVQDGGSDDETQEILQQFAARLHACESAPDNGQSHAIAKGFAKTTGAPTDIMAWLNADDCYLSGALQFVRAYFARHPEVDVIYGNRVLIDEDSSEIGRWFLPSHDPCVLRLNDFVPQETLFWRRRIWDRVGGVDTSLRFALDWDLLLRFAAAGAKIVHVPYFLACFRIHSQQKTSAQMHSVGQAEIDLLRQRTLGHILPPEKLARDPHLRRYLRRSALVEWLWHRGIRFH